jgi:hypothetical protein
MARALGLAVGLILLATPSASAYTEPSGELVRGSEETVLRLHDLPPGYQIGDESGCGPLGPIEGGSEGRFEKRYLKWVLRYRPEGCGYQYEQVFEVPGLEPAPPLVEAGTLNTPSEAAAVSGFELFATLISRFKEGQRRKTVSIPLSGTQALLIRSKNELVEGESGQPATLLFWRSGKLISFVEAAGMNPRHNDRVALHFAQVQQERLEHPSPYTEAEQDDAGVWLDDPGLKLPVYWVGRSFLPGRGLPDAELLDAFPTAGGAGPPGTKLALEYGGFALYTWTRQSWKRFQPSALGKLNRKGRCGHTTEVELEQGSAVVYSDYGARHQGACPHHPPDRNWAIARIGEVVIGVNLAICTLCLDRGEGPYNSVRGMKAILRALEVRPKPVY